MKTSPPYAQAYEACGRIGENAKTLSDMISILRFRPELPDDAMYSAVAAERIAKAVIENSAGPYGQNPNDWPNRIANLEGAKPLAAMVAARVIRVRQNVGLQQSHSAEQIRGKYGSLAAEFADSLANQRVPMTRPLSESHF